MSRPRTRKGHYISPSNIPGAEGCEPPAESFLMCGVVWTPADARRDTGAPIGLELAKEWAAAEAQAATGNGAGEPDEAA